MGLPSGTQWRCCNEGESFPSDVGHYYVFGVVPSAPTLEQMEELFANCTIEWPYGCKLTGPNGKSICLPKGYYWSSTPYPIDDKVHAYFLDLSVSGRYKFNILLGDREGFWVRPVRYK